MTTLILFFNYVNDRKFRENYYIGAILSVQSALLALSTKKPQWMAQRLAGNLRGNQNLIVISSSIQDSPEKYSI